MLQKSFVGEKVEEEEEKEKQEIKMEATKTTIPHEIGGIQNDPLRFGLQGVKSDIVGSHPLQSAYHSVLPHFYPPNLFFISQFVLTVTLPLL